MSQKRKKLICLSFFSGALGLDLGLERAGIKTILASEIDQASCETIKLNRPDITLIKDIRDYTSEEVKKAAGLKPNAEIDLIVGGPPCQAFSTAGKRQGFEDQRGNVFLKFIELIAELRPRYAVIENVRGLLSAPLLHRPHSERGRGFPPLTPEECPGGALFHILTMLRSHGYGINFNLYSSANFGAPQIRERVIILCSLDGAKLPYLKPTHSGDGSFGLPPWRTFREAVAGLPSTPCDFVKFPEKRLRFYRLLTQGQNWRDLPKDLQPEALGGAYLADGGKVGFLRRLAWDSPAPTLVTHPAMPATDLAHPVEDRPLSVQEYKRVQEFPDDYKVCGSLLDQYRQIGNAVPTSLGMAVGRALIAHDAGKKIINLLDFPYSRYLRTDEVSWERDYVKQQAQFNQQTFDLV